MTQYDLLLKGGLCYLPSNKSVKPQICDIAIYEGKIAEIGHIKTQTAKSVFKAEQLCVLPGLIDTQVHFREPGLEHKEDIASGSRGALKGGLTGFFEMPNTAPPTSNAINFNDKLTRAQNRSWVNYAFFIGATEDNVDELADLENLPGCCGIKIFMGSSTGTLLVHDKDKLDRILAMTKAPISVHSEDETRLNERKSSIIEGDVASHPLWRDELTALTSTKKIVALAQKNKRKIHILHMTTAEELEFLKSHKDYTTIECTPQHLTFSAPECYETLGTLAQMNPPIRELYHQQALWKALETGFIDIIGSDHAPHTREEKKRTYPKSPSGMTGVQTTVPVMLNHIHEGRLSLERLIELMAVRPSQIFGIKNKGAIKEGFDADFTIVDLKAQRTIENSWIESKSAWTPYHGKKITGWPVASIINGNIALRDDQILGPPQGRAFEFKPRY